MFSFHLLFSNKKFRKFAWPFLLNVWEKNSSGTQRHGQEEKLKKQYESLRNGWINAVPQLFDEEMKQYIKVCCGSHSNFKSYDSLL